MTSSGSFSAFLHVAVQTFGSPPIGIDPFGGHLSCCLELEFREGKKVIFASDCMPKNFVGLGASLRVCCPAVEMPIQWAWCRISSQRPVSRDVYKPCNAPLAKDTAGEVG